MGSDRRSLPAGVAISAVNWAEVLSKLADLGSDPDREAQDMLEYGPLAEVLAVIPLDDSLAREVARLRLSTRRASLSLGDRACLALARHLGVPALTTDRAWARLKLPVKVRAIR
jgi:ribonuclease VapC